MKNKQLKILINVGLTRLAGESQIKFLLDIILKERTEVAKEIFKDIERLIEKNPDEPVFMIAPDFTKKPIPKKEVFTAIKEYYTLKNKYIGKQIK